MLAARFALPPPPLAHAALRARARTRPRRSTRKDDYKIKDTQRQVDEVVGIMRGNVEKVLERDQKLGDLEDKSGAAAACVCWRAVSACRMLAARVSAIPHLDTYVHSLPPPPLATGTCRSRA